MGGGAIGIGGGCDGPLKTTVDTVGSVTLSTPTPRADEAADGLETRAVMPLAAAAARSALASTTVVWTRTLAAVTSRVIVEGGTLRYAARCEV